MRKRMSIKGDADWPTAPPHSWWYFTAFGYEVYIDYLSTRKFLTIGLHLDKSNSSVNISLAKFFIVTSHIVG
jgi:hypothetical protein